MAQAVVMIMAGGKGSRLGPLTCHRAKPSVPFGGRYRIVDFVLSNFVNSGYRQVYVLTQYMASSLISHISRNWHLWGIDEFIEIVPAQMRHGEHWYRGTADSVYQNVNLIEDAGADTVAVFGGDHIYKFDIEQMEDYHRDIGADLTVAACPVPRSEATEFGVIQVDERGKITGFQEKPDDPTPIPGRPDTCLVSMGNYFFESKVLTEALAIEAGVDHSTHDFGKGIIPRLVEGGASVYTYDFGTNELPGEKRGERPYWRDVGTIDSYVTANMDVVSPVPHLNIYSRAWRIRTAQRDFPPGRFVAPEHGHRARMDDSMVCEGSIVIGANLRHVVVGYDCFIHANSSIEESVMLSGCDVGAGATLRGVLMDKNCSIARGAEIGVDPQADRERFPWITPNGIIALPKGTHVPVDGPITLARDMALMLENDPPNAAALERFPGSYLVGDHGRHSHVSAGPRYRRFGADGSVTD